MRGRWPTIGVLAAVAGCGLIEASPWAIAGGALALTGQRAEACAAFADKYGAALGRLEAWSLFAAVSAARSTLNWAAAYAAGLALRWYT